MRSIEIAKNLLNLNVEIPIIMKSTGLSKKKSKNYKKIFLEKTS